MENKDNIVDLVSEPKINTRFGFGKENKVLSSKTIKYCVIATGVAVSSVFLMKAPQKVDSNYNGVKTPDASEVSASQSSTVFDFYSATEESSRIRESSVRSKRAVIVKLPGIQKIDRRRSGQIPPASMIKAILLSGASNGPVRVEVTESLRIQGETLIPAGATMFGSGQSTEERLIIRFSKVIFKDGSFEDISAQAADIEDKTIGLRGSRVGKYAMKYAAAVGLNFAGGMAEGLQDREVVGQQVVTKPSARNALLNGASKATLEMANDSMTELRNNAPIIHIPVGTEIYVMFESGL